MNATLANEMKKMTTTIQEAKALWESFTHMCTHQDEAVLDLYTNESLIYENAPGYKEMVKPGSIYIPFTRAILRAANRKGEQILDSTFHNVDFVRIGKHVGINAIRHSNVKDFDSPFSLLVGKTADGKVVILEERMEHLMDEPLEYVEVTIETKDNGDGQQERPG